MKGNTSSSSETLSKPLFKPPSTGLDIVQENKASNKSGDDTVDEVLINCTSYQKAYTLDKERALKKKLQAMERKPMCITDKSGNLVTTFSTSSFEQVRKATLPSQASQLPIRSYLRSL